jgi:hydroxymethylglutaryl-CoA reductase
LQEQLGKDKKTFKQWLSEMIENYIGGVKWPKK